MKFDFDPALINLNVNRNEFFQPTVLERNRRWHEIRSAMSDRGIDCLLLSGSSARWNEMNANIRYVANYADPISGESYAIFPLTGDGTLLTQWEPKRSAYAMSWFEDVRGLLTTSLAEIVVARISELGLRQGTLGLVGEVFGPKDMIGIPWNQLEKLKAKLPEVAWVDATDIFSELRTWKSDEEIACLTKSADLVDIGFAAHAQYAEPGTTEQEYYSHITHAMEIAGAEPPTFLLLQSGPMPYEMLTQDALPSQRQLAESDVIISETSPKWAGYQAQGLQCTVLGQATSEMRELAKYGAEIWHTCAGAVRPGNTVNDVVSAGDAVIERARRSQLGELADGLRPLLIPAGLSGFDPFPKDGVIGPNQAYMLEIGPGARPYAPPQHINGGCLVVTTEKDPITYNQTYSIEDRLLTEVR